MSKTYFILIGGLVVLALVIGGFAFYRSSKVVTPAAPTYNTAPDQNNPTTTQAVQQSSPTISPAKNQITLTVTSPKNGTEVFIPTIKVVGKTVPNADVSVNDDDLKADAQGNFSAAVNLDEGENFISVLAIDDLGNVAEAELTVTYTPTQ